MAIVRCLTGHAEDGTWDPCKILILDPGQFHHPVALVTKGASGHRECAYVASLCSYRPRRTLFIRFVGAI